MSEPGFTILKMERHGEFYAAMVVDPSAPVPFPTPVHNRYGAWFGGDPDAPRGTPMKDLPHKLCAMLAEKKREVHGAWLKANPVFSSGNPFLPGGAVASNPFIPAAPTTATPAENPFINNPFIQ